MTKPWHEKPLWERVWLGPNSCIYLHAGKLIGHLGCGAFAFWDAAKLRPDYDKLKYENAVRDLTVYAQREQGQYELHASARKVLRVILGPAPEDPEYVAWWRGRLVSVRRMREEGTEPEFAAEPPVPLPAQVPEESPAKETPKKKRPKKKARG